MKKTLNQLIAVIVQAEKLFERAARAWTRGNNSGNSKDMLKGQDECEEYRKQAELMLSPFGITCDYPGLYPSFKVNGFDHHSVQSAVSAAVGTIIPQFADTMKDAKLHAGMIDAKGNQTDREAVAS